MIKRTYKGVQYTIEPQPDHDPINPFEDWDGMGEFFWADRHDLFNLMRENPNSIAVDVYEHSGYALTVNQAGTDYMRELVKWEDEEIEDHPSPPPRRGCEFDTSPCRLLWVPDAEHLKNPEQLYEIAESYTKLYDQVLNGDCYGFVTTIDDEEIDSCWGFWGWNHEESGLLEHAISGAECEINHRIEKARQSRVKQYEYIKKCIRNRVPLIYREEL